MAIAITTDTSGFTFIEAAGNNGAIANNLTLKIAGGTFSGDNGDVLDVAFTGVPGGLTARLVKTSGTTAQVSFTGTATAHTNAQDVSNLGITFKASNFATGDFPAELKVANLRIDFKDPAAAGTLTLVAPEGAGTNATYNKDNLPKIGGTAPAGVENVYIFNNGGKSIATVPVTEGRWEFTLPTTKLKDGAYNLTASATNDSQGAMTAGFAFTVDTKLPSAPSINAIKGGTSDTTPVLTGKAEKGATVDVYLSEEQIPANLLGTTKADAKGLWTLTVTNNKLALGGDITYKLTATATDAAGNSAKTKKAVDLIIDTTIETPTIDESPVINKGTATLTGTADIGSTVQLYGGPDGSLAIGKVLKVDKNGKWKTSVKLSEAVQLFSVVATDAAGNVSANSALKELSSDTSTPVPTLALEGLNGLRGTAEPGATVTITIGKQKFSAIADAEGNWTHSFIGFKPDSDKPQKITATATDAAGNISKSSEALTVTFTPESTTASTTPTPGADALTATAEGQALDGLAGNDTIIGGVGNDTLTGGAGADSITGGAGDDVIRGDQADVVLDGGEGTDVLEIGANFTASATATIVGFESVELTATGLKVDLSNKSGGFHIKGVATGASTIVGGGGNDSIVGGTGNDSLTGGLGNDTLSGGAGNDTLTGGAGKDVFKFTDLGATNGVDTITDFKVADGDVLDFSALLSGGQLLNTVGSGSVIETAIAAVLAVDGSAVPVPNNRAYVINQSGVKASIDTAAEVVAALTDGALKGVKIAASAHALLLVSGTDDANTVFVYGVSNDATAAVTTDELVLIGTITTDAPLLATSLAFS